MSSEDLKKNLHFYIENQKSLVEKYNGKTLLIHACAVVGTFGSASEALHEGMEKFIPGTFTIMRCEEGDAAYTVNARTVHRFSALVAS